MDQEQGCVACRGFKDRLKKRKGLDKRVTWVLLLFRVAGAFESVFNPVAISGKHSVDHHPLYNYFGGTKQMADYDQEVAIAQKEADKLSIAVAKVLPIKSKDGLQEATNLLNQIKFVSKNISNVKNPIIKSLNDSLRQVRDLFRKPEERLFDAERQIKDEMLKYYAKIEVRIDKKVEKIEAKVDTGKMNLAEGVQKLANIEEPKVEGAQFRVIKKIRIVDLGKLPQSYFLRERVQEAIRIEVADDVLRKHLPVPMGAEVYEEKIVAGGAK